MQESTECFFADPEAVCCCIWAFKRRRVCKAEIVQKLKMAFNQCCNVKYCMQAPANSRWSAVLRARGLWCSAGAGSGAAAGIGEAVGGRVSGVRVLCTPAALLRHRVMLKSAPERLRCGIPRRLCIASRSHRDPCLT